MVRPTARRKRHIATRRAQILEAAARLFAAKGFHYATTREIAEAADIAEGTLYNYFESKGDLLVGVMALLAEEEAIPAALTERLQGDTRDLFVAMFRHRMGRIEAGQEMLQAILPEVMVDAGLRERFYQQFVLRVATLLERCIQAWAETGRIRPVDAALTARAVQSMFVGLLIMRILGDEVVLSRWEDVPSALATIIFDGLTPKEEG